MADLEWLQHEVGNVKDVLAKLDVKEESPVSTFVKELKKLAKRKTMIFHAAGDEQKKVVARLNQLFVKNKLTGKYSVRKDLEAGMVYVYKRRKDKKGVK